MKNEIWIKHTAEQRKAERRAELKRRWSERGQIAGITYGPRRRGATCCNLGDGCTMKLNLMPRY